MKYLSTGDWHTTDKKPDNRTDESYLETCLSKIEFVLDTAISYGCDAVLQPGDLFDSALVSYYVFRRLVDLIGSKEIYVVTVFGQHDLKYRNKDSSPLFALQSALNNQVIIADKEPVFDMIYGASYGEEIPNHNSGSILLTHRMVINEKLWPGQTEFEGDSLLLRKTNFGLIVSGDNHQNFFTKSSNRFLVNCGALVRDSITLVEHKPSVFIYDTENNMALKEIKVPIKKGVFQMDKVEREKEVNKELDTFIDGLSQYKEMGLCFEDNLRAYIKENKMDKEIETILLKGIGVL
jgi:hypothetical protein